jgi:riboflavin synthase
MFTGIIENTGTVEEIIQNRGNKSFLISSPISAELKVDQSLSHNGVCLTVEETGNGRHRVTAIAETLSKTNLGHWQPGSLINLERCMQLNGRLDGHMVQGHVDCVARCTQVVEKDGSWEYSFEFPESFRKYIIEKGSVTLNGISLTCFNLTGNQFSVAIIPYTYQHTNMRNTKIGDILNIEWDMVGKYINRIMEINS